MKVLIVVATKKEAEIFINKLNLNALSQNIFINQNISIIVAGVGVQTTIFELTKYLSMQTPDLIINTGIAGAFKNTVSIGSSAYVKSDYFADLGFYKNDSFINIFNSNFNKQYSHIFSDGKILADNIPDFFNNIPKVNAITVNTAENISIPDSNVSLESMEGAAVMMVAKLFKINCMQIRAVSNIIKENSKSSWEIDPAINNYSNLILKYISKIN